MRSLFCVFALIALVGNVAQATVVLDDFSDPNAYSKYNAVGSGQWYQVNGSGQFQPGASDTTSSVGWLRNDVTLNVGDSVSLDVWPTTPAASGLCWSDSATSLSHWGDMLLNGQSDWQYLGSFSAEAYQDGVNLLNSSIQWNIDKSQALTITATRTNASTLNLGFAYHDYNGNPVNLTATATGLTAAPYYFGMYNNPLWSSGGIMDNLSRTAAPEPSTLVLVVTGLVGLLAYAWRKRK